MTQDGGPGSRAIRISRLLAADPDRVFKAWLDPGSMARWLSPTGRALAVTDPRPSGAFRVVMLGDQTGIEHEGRYLELEPGRRHRFTWRSAYTAGDSVVTVELEPVDGGTQLTLIHDELPHEHVEPHAGGWTAILGLLEAELLRADEMAGHSLEAGR